MTDNAIIRDLSTKPSAAIIWMHGLGADGNDFLPIVDELGLNDMAIRFVFPHAPQIPVTINMGMRMPAWYDIRRPQINRDEDHAGIENSRRRITSILDTLAQQGIPAKRTVLAGFSQGGAMALHCGLRHAERLAGILALSCYLPLANSCDKERSTSNQETPIFMAQGSNDPVVPRAIAHASMLQLRDLGYTVEWHEYSMEHSVCIEEIQDIGAWLRKTLK